MIPSLNGKTKKVIFWGGGMLGLATFMVALTQIDKGLTVVGKITEPYFTEKVREELLLDRAAVLALAKKHDQDQEKLIKEFRDIERRLGDKLDANNMEFLRLVIKAIDSQ